MEVAPRGPSEAPALVDAAGTAVGDGPCEAGEPGVRKLWRGGGQRVEERKGSRLKSGWSIMVGDSEHPYGSAYRLGALQDQAALAQEPT